MAFTIIFLSTFKYHQENGMLTGAAEPVNPSHSSSPAHQLELLTSPSPNPAHVLKKIAESPALDIGYSTGAGLRKSLFFCSFS
jgi:hypothetical protein